MSTGWEKLPNVPEPYIAVPLLVNDNEFIIAPQRCSDNLGDGIHKFTIDKKEWSKIIKYPENLRSPFHTNAINLTDPNNPIIYIVNGNENSFLIADVTKQTIKTVTTNINTDGHPRAIYIHGQLHVIGGGGSFKHLIYDESKQKFIEIYDFKSFHSGNTERGFARHTLIYSESRDSMFMFGGTISPFNKSVFQYMFSSKEWKKLDCESPEKMKGHGCVITEDEKYVIIIAGCDMRNIYVFDIDNLSFHECKIKAPSRGWCYSCLISNHKRSLVLANGYIREYYDGEYFMTELTKIIAEFMMQQDLYWLSFKGSKGHQRINVSAILDSASLC